MNLSRPIRLSLALAVLALSSQAHAMFYDPFPDAASVKPSDELEDRLEGVTTVTTEKAAA